MGKSISSFFYIKKMIKKHKIAIFLAILIGIIMALPHIYFIFDNKDIYNGIFMGGLDEGPYLTRMQEVRDGHYFMSNPFWSKGKDNPYLWPPLPEIFSSGFGLIFGLNLINTVLVENFIFSFFLFFIIYSLVYQLVKKKSVALISSLTIMLMPNLTDPRTLWQLLVYQNVADTFLAYSRLISPQIHSLFLFSFFLFFWMFLKNKKWINGIISGILLGLLFYIYPFAWMFVASFFVFLVLIHIFKKEWVEIKNVVIISFIALLVACPFLFNLIEAMQSLVYSEVSFRYGWVENNSPQIGITILVLLVIFLLFFPKKDKKRYDFSLAIVLTPLILMNQQLITGYLLGPARYHHYYYKPFAIIFLLIIISSRLKKIWKWLIVLILLIGFYNAWLVQTASYLTHESSGINDQKYGDIFNWLNKNGDKDDSVVANLYISDLIPIYTSLNAETNLDAHYSLTSNQQLLKRMFLLYRLDGVGIEDVKDIFYRDREIISKNIFAQKYHKKFGGYEFIPDKELDLFIDRYLNNLEISIEDFLRELEIRYLIWDVFSDATWNINQYLFLDLVYDKDGFKIYEIN